MDYLMIELLIVATALILFVVSFCGFLQKWRLYVQELEAENSKSIDEKNKSSNLDQPPSYFTVQIDLPPKYDEAIKMPQYANEDLVLKVQNLPQPVNVHGQAGSTPEQLKSNNSVEIV